MDVESKSLGEAVKNCLLVSALSICLMTEY